jgi:hypothetical protein
MQEENPTVRRVATNVTIKHFKKGLYVPVPD